MQEGWGIDELATDYAQCAKWAIESGADCVETNFSCPNVTTCDGQLYLDMKESAIVSEAVKSAIGQTPLIIKVGHFVDHEMIPLFLSAVDRHTNAVSMTNSIASRVGESDSELMFESQQRGICGRGILDASLEQVRAFAHAIEERESKIEVIGLGGIETATDVRRYINAGASVCHLATHPMVDPACGIKIREHLATQPLG
jgi:dihydroorotate dehydrogenase